MVQQWEDELSTHAPTLKLSVHYTPADSGLAVYDEYEVAIFKEGVDQSSGLTLRDRAGSGPMALNEVVVDGAPEADSISRGKVMAGEVLLQIDGEKISAVAQAHA